MMSGTHQMTKTEEKAFRLDAVRHLGNRITEIRAEKGMKQKDVSEKLRFYLSDIAISQYENGRQEMKVVTFIEIARALGVTPNDLCEAFPNGNPLESDSPNGYDHLNKENKAMIDKIVSALLFQQKKS